MITLYKKDWSYTLEKSDNDIYYLSVLVGGVAVHEIKIKLNQIEIKKLNENGEDYIISLVKNIQEFPSNWAERNIT